MNLFRTWFCLWLLAVLLSCYVRLYPLRAHIWDPSYDQASMYVIYNIKKSLLDVIRAQAPQISEAEAQQMATEKLNEILRKDSAKVQTAIANANRKIFEASGKPANIYLLESDTFYFYYLTENIVKNGRMAEVIKGSKYLDPLMKAPDGFWQPLTYHPYVGYWVYRIFQLFDPHVPLMTAVAYTPVILIVFVLAAFFLACRTLGIGAISAFAGSLVFSLAPVILKRSSLGWYRTDPYNLLFTILLLVILLKAVENRTLRNTWIYILSFGLCISAFAAIWQGWGFMLAMAAAVLSTCSAYALLNKDTLSLRHFVFLGIGVLFSTLLGISFLFGFNEFFTLLKEGFGELQKFTVKKFNVWPNLFMEVGELKKSSSEDFLADSGGILILIGGLAGFCYSLIYNFIHGHKSSFFKTIVLSVFFVVCVLMASYAERFAIFALIGLSLFFALGLEGLFSHIRWFKDVRVRIAIAALVSLLVFINGNKSIKTVLTPIFNSAWEQALLEIKNKTPQDSIVNCWWPPGHFIKGIAHRRVMFDGATLSESATGYWMANVFLNENEAVSANLLRMLNLSGNKAVDFLTSKGLKTSSAVALVTSLASKSDSEIKHILQSVLKNNSDANTLWTLLRGGAPHSYVLLYNELVDNNLGLAFMGRWNIPRIEALNENPALLASVPDRHSPAYLDFLWDLAGGQTHYSPSLLLLNEDENNYYFSENLIINKSTMKANIDSSTYGKGIPLSIVYLNKHQITENLNLNSNLKYTVVIYQQDGLMLARLMDQELANSTLIKLFFFDAAGMEHFKILTSSRDLTNRTQIKVFQVQW